MGDRRRARQALVEATARWQGGVLSRSQVYALGITRSETRAEVRADRWALLGSQSLQVGPPDAAMPWWRAVFEVGPTAVLDGISALQAAGLRTITSDAVQVAVPKSAEYRQCRGVRIHETRRYREEDVVRVGIPRTKPATAAVHAALWALSDAQAALFVIAPVQQRLVAVRDLAEAIALIKRHKRRRLLHGLLADVSDGVESVGEREFAAACRRRRFPPSTRQVVRQLPSGRVRWDTVWDDYELDVEIEGVQHLDAATAMRDVLKQNAAAMQGPAA